MSQPPDTLATSPVPTATPDAALPPASRKLLNDPILQVGATVIAVTAVAFLVRGLLGDKPAQASWVVQVLLGACTVCGICWGAWQRHKLLSLPIRRLSLIVEKVRQGEVPLDELSKVDGVPGLLVPVVRDLLLDIRRQQQATAQLELEMSQRVANRTDALERALGSLREKASRDAMTGLYNRRMLDDTLPKLVTQALADTRPLAVLMIDVDYFKLLNDTLGHAAGDELLRSIGQIIRSTVRESDLAFRAGGDEFVVVMPGADPAATHALADRLISLVDGLAKTLKVHQPPRLSIGTAHLRETHEPTTAALMAAADKALYAIKGTRKRGVATVGAGANELR